MREMIKIVLLKATILLLLQTRLSLNLHSCVYLLAVICRVLADGGVNVWGVPRSGTSRPKIEVWRIVVDGRFPGVFFDDLVLASTMSLQPEKSFP